MLNGSDKNLAPGELDAWLATIPVLTLDEAKEADRHKNQRAAENLGKSTFRTPAPNTPNALESQPPHVATLEPPEPRPALSTEPTPSEPQATGERSPAPPAWTEMRRNPVQEEMLRRKSIRLDPIWLRDPERGS